jgi:acyl-coenzyme A synthetase/AMP-(fatty) acid ligase
MINLSQILASEKGNEFSFVLPESTCDSSQLLAKAAQLSASFPLGGRRVMIKLRHLNAALPWMIACDGLASSIALVNSGLSREALGTLSAQGKFDTIIDEDGPSELAERDLAKLSKDRPFESEWVLTTSGTTGTPKMVSHTLASLTRTTKTHRLAGPPTVWGLLYGFDRFAGLQVMLQAMLSGSKLVDVIGEASLGDRLVHFSKNKVSHLSASPTLWRKILMTPEADGLELRSITLGGEIANQDILDQLSKRFADARIAHIYASTEAGVGFSVRDKLAGFPATYLDNPPAGVRLRIHENILQIQVDNPSQYVGTDKVIANEQGWIATADLVEACDDRILFKGRADATINVGGLKVQPEIVESALENLLEVQSARVFGKANPITGMLVMAEVQLAGEFVDAKTVTKNIRLQLAERLADHEIPARIHIVKEMQINASGKVQRQ